MKKQNLLFSLYTILVSFFIISCNTVENTEKILKIEYTDITAYINGIPIPSYNINGNTAIVAEDLNEYGFEVFYYTDPETSNTSLEIYYDGSWKEVTADGILLENTFVSEEVSPSGIITHINNMYSHEINSYNVNGKILIFIDDLAIYGDVKWYADQRKICFDYTPDWEITLEDDHKGDTSKEILDFTIKANKNSNGTFDSTGENRNYISDIRLSWDKEQGLYIRFSLYQRVLSQTTELGRMLYDIVTIDKEGEIRYPNADIANQHVTIYVNGEKINIKSVGEGLGNGHHDYYLYLDTDIKNKENIQSFEITYK
ncbi:hypothetical protein [Clostridium sp. MD294]|uniref:hypothetical protein n=1 Tax=Clostridium sp. MD294 TaxID=97138 RepID=UPI0002CC6C3E|nr:hypothetical protein [Clostridium sp. MD294]NDO46513.1 hypothetical protein [Clostridium sp. MD294]USF29058.1 hypothetical protein C820_000441 [Clostridium sp. MD294]